MLATAAQGSIILVFTYVIILALNYLFNLGLGWLLSPAQYGIYGVAIAILEVFSIFVTRVLGLTTVKLIAEADSTIEKKALIFKSSLITNLLVAVAVSGLFFIVTYFFKLVDEKYLIPMVIAILLVSSLNSIYFSALIGFFRFKGRGIAELLGAVMKVLSGVFLVYLGFGVIGAFGGYVLGIVVSLVVAVFLLRDFKFWKSSGRFDRRVLTYAFPVLVAALMMMVMQNVDILGIKLLTDKTQANQLAGYYQAALVIGRFPLYLAAAMMVAVFPFISKFERGGASTYANLAIKYATIFILPISVMVAFKPEAFIRLLFPDVYLQAAPALTVLAVGTGLMCLSLILMRTFQGVGQFRFPALVMSGAVVLQIVLLSYLVPRLGIIGAAFSGAIASLASLIILGYAYWKQFRMVKLKGILTAILSLGVLAIMASFMPVCGRPATLVILVAMVIVYTLTLPLFRSVTERDTDILLGVLPDNRWVRKCSLWAKQVVIRLNNVF